MVEAPVFAQETESEHLCTRQSEPGAVLPQFELRESTKKATGAGRNSSVSLSPSRFVRRGSLQLMVSKELRTTFGPG